MEYPKLLKRNRKVTSVNACMATKDHPHVVEFYSFKGIGGIKGNILIDLILKVPLSKVVIFLKVLIVAISK